MINVMISKRKIVLCMLTATVLLVIMCPFTRCYAKTDVEKETENAINNADELLSENTFDKLFDSLTEGARTSVRNFSSVFAMMLFTTFMLGVMRLMSGDGAPLYAGQVCLCSMSFSVVSRVCDNVVLVLDELESFMLSALPAMTALYTASSAPVTAAVNHGTTILILNICTAVFTSVIIPCIKCITAFSVVTFISSSFDLSGFTSFLKNTAGWLFGLLMCIMSSVVALRTTISGARDGLMGRTVRFAASRFIPVIGNTVSESARTISESLKLVRSVTGVSGIFAIFAIIASPVAAILICRTFISICAACAGMFSCTKTAAFLGELSGIMNLLLGVTVGISMILIIILGVFAKSTFQI